MAWIYSTVELNCWFHALDCFSYGFWTWKLNKLSSHVSFFCLPSLSTLFHFLTLPSFTSLPPLFYLSFTQGQRHEESAGFPAEEEWVPRKQPSREVRQIYEISQVSGHFLTGCACGCVSDGFLDLTTTWLLEDRYVGRDGSVLAVWHQLNEWESVWVRLACQKEGRHNAWMQPFNFSVNYIHRLSRFIFICVDHLASSRQSKYPSPMYSRYS